MKPLLACGQELAGDDRARQFHEFLRSKFPEIDGEIMLSRASGGMSNPTFFVEAGTWSAVLRKKPGVNLVKSAHAIDREFRVISALHGTTVPVPRPILYHAAPDVLDTPFYLMERLHGRVFDAYGLPGLTRDERRACYDSMARIVASLHNLDWQALGLTDFGRPGNSYERQFKRWSELWDQYRSMGNPQLDQLQNWLASRIPETDRLALCHGDLRIGNLMFHATQPEVMAVLDWELSTLGHPFLDLGFNTLAWELEPGELGGLRGLDVSHLGIPSYEDYLQMYYRHAGEEERLAPVHRVFVAFRAAVGSAGISVRGQQGNSVSAGAAEVGRRLSHIYARRGLDLIDAA